MPIFAVIVRLMTLNTDLNTCMPFIPYITFIFNISISVFTCLTSHKWDTPRNRVGTYTISHIYEPSTIPL